MHKPIKRESKQNCSYCGTKPKLVTGKEIYPHRPELWGKLFWYCKKCKAYVGCHPDTEKPLGRLANRELRLWKMKAHAAFDRIWKEKKMQRKKAYFWLAVLLEVPFNDCHIGMFNVDMCKKVVTICNQN